MKLGKRRLKFKFISSKGKKANAQFSMRETRLPGKSAKHKDQRNNEWTLLIPDLDRKAFLKELTI